MKLPHDLFSEETLARFVNSQINAVMFTASLDSEAIQELDVQGQEAFGPDTDNLAMFMTWASATGII